MRPSTLALGFVCGLAFLPTAAHADPVTMLYASSPGVTADAGGFSVNGPSINLGNITFNGGSEAFVMIDGLAPGANYVFSFKALDPAGQPWTSLTAEVLIRCRMALMRWIRTRSRAMSRPGSRRRTTRMG